MVAELFDRGQQVLVAVGLQVREVAPQLEVGTEGRQGEAYPQACPDGPLEGRYVTFRGGESLAVGVVAAQRLGLVHEDQHVPRPRLRRAEYARIHRILTPGRNYDDGDAG